jgi:tRNA G18 (ribose-2'-O)-methylase SpoU
MTELTIRCARSECSEVISVPVELAWRRVSCPRCGAEGSAIPADVRRRLAERGPGGPLPGLGPQALVAVLEDLRSVHNVGSILRSADAFAVDLVVMAGITPTPEHPRLARTALGAEHTVPWAWRSSALGAVRELARHGLAIIAMEDGAGAEPLAGTRVELPAALVIGNEVAGISSPVLEAADRRLAIPMRGVKTSLNAAVAFGIAAFAARSAPAV